MTGVQYTVLFYISSHFLNVFLMRPLLFKIFKIYKNLKFLFKTFVLILFIETLACIIFLIFLHIPTKLDRNVTALDKFVKTAQN